MRRASQNRPGHGVYVHAGGSSGGGVSPWASTSINYWGLSVPLAYLGGGWCASNPGLTVAQAHAIDQKIDDGMPVSGNVLAAYVNGTPNNPVATAAGYGTGWGTPDWVNPGGTSYTSPGMIIPPSSAIQGSAQTCYDNGDSAGATPQYSMSQGSNNLNCALTFKFQ